MVQEQSGDKFGNIANKDLYRLLELFIQEGHESYCLITNRVSLLEFMEDSAYREHPVTSLSLNDGRLLLAKSGAVTGVRAILLCVEMQWMQNWAMSMEMGYHWGQVDAREVLDR